MARKREEVVAKWEQRTIEPHPVERLRVEVSWVPVAEQASVLMETFEPTSGVLIAHQCTIGIPKERVEARIDEVLAQFLDRHGIPNDYGDPFEDPPPTA